MKIKKIILTSVAAFLLVVLAAYFILNVAKNTKIPSVSLFNCKKVNCVFLAGVPDTKELNGLDKLDLIYELNNIKPWHFLDKDKVEFKEYGMGYPIVAYRFTINNYKNIEKYIDVTLNTTLNCILISFKPSDFKKDGSQEVETYYVKVGKNSYLSQTKALKYLGLNENYETIK